MLAATKHNFGSRTHETKHREREGLLILDTNIHFHCHLRSYSRCSDRAAEACWPYPPKHPEADPRQRVPVGYVSTHPSPFAIFSPHHTGLLELHQWTSLSDPVTSRMNPAAGGSHHLTWAFSPRRLRRLPLSYSRLQLQVDPSRLRPAKRADDSRAWPPRLEHYRFSAHIPVAAHVLLCGQHQRLHRQHHYSRNIFYSLRTNSIRLWFESSLAFRDHATYTCITASMWHTRGRELGRTV